MRFDPELRETDFNQWVINQSQYRKEMEFYYITEYQTRVELTQAIQRFAPFNSAHEGFAVLKEEVDELWDEVKAKQGARDVDKMRKEAIQVAAMAMRFVIDVCDAQRGQV